MDKSERVGGEKEDERESTHLYSRGIAGGVGRKGGRWLVVQVWSKERESWVGGRYCYLRFIVITDGGSLAS